MLSFTHRESVLWIRVGEQDDFLQNSWSDLYHFLICCTEPGCSGHEQGCILTWKNKWPHACHTHR